MSTLYRKVIKNELSLKIDKQVRSHESTLVNCDSDRKACSVSVLIVLPRKPVKALFV